MKAGVRMYSRDCLDYVDPIEAMAVAFVRKYLKQARGHWVDILDTYAPEKAGYRADGLEFRRVTCALFPRRMRVPRLNRSEFYDEAEYRAFRRNLVWETAHRDIERQRRSGYKGRGYVIEGVRYKARMPGYRINSDVSQKLKHDLSVLLENPNDRTDPLWDVMLNCMHYDDGYDFRIKSVRRM